MPFCAITHCSFGNNSLATLTPPAGLVREKLPWADVAAVKSTIDSEVCLRVVSLPLAATTMLLFSRES